MGLFSSLVGAGISAAAEIGAASINAKGARRVAAENREFQLQVSNTAYQRGTEDLQAAGLNRILALGGPASSPSGTVAQPPDYSGVGNSALQAFRAGNERQRLTQEIKNMKSDKKETDWNSNLLRSKQVLALYEAQNKQAHTALMKAALPTATLEGKVSSSAFGEAAAYMSRGIKGASPFIQRAIK